MKVLTFSISLVAHKSTSINQANLTQLYIYIAMIREQDSDGMHEKCGTPSANFLLL